MRFGVAGAAIEIRRHPMVFAVPPLEVDPPHLVRLEEERGTGQEVDDLARRQTLGGVDVGLAGADVVGLRPAVSASAPVDAVVAAGQGGQEVGADLDVGPRKADPEAGRLRSARRDRRRGRRSHLRSDVDDECWLPAGSPPLLGPVLRRHMGSDAVFGQQRPQAGQGTRRAGQYDAAIEGSQQRRGVAVSAESVPVPRVVGERLGGEALPGRLRLRVEEHPLVEHAEYQFDLRDAHARGRGEVLDAVTPVETGKEFRGHQRRRGALQDEPPRTGGDHGPLGCRDDVGAGAEPRPPGAVPRRRPHTHCLPSGSVGRDDAHVPQPWTPMTVCDETGAALSSRIETIRFAAASSERILSSTDAASRT